GKGRKLKDGQDIAILSIGHPGNFVQTAIRNLRTEGLDPAHYDMRFVKPIDETLLHEVFQKFDKIITVEDGTVQGGFGSAVLEFMAAHKYQASVKIMGIPDQFIEHGTPKDLQKECAFDSAGISQVVREMMGTKIQVAGNLEQ
ncbi:MAG TPA: transketolase C-terminal domain-containing protein, partial [Puia sp.]|nr:transketolase C-terminal domain-containing protein [Puia sp.]